MVFSSITFLFYFLPQVVKVNTLMIQGNWKSDENMNQHIRSDEYPNLLLVLEMSLKQAESGFDTISSSTGIETIEEIRNAIHMG